ncbi:hypothetical protein ACWDYH_15270 [Nocardia goodfellowii]
MPFLNFSFFPGAEAMKVAYRPARVTEDGSRVLASVDILFSTDDGDARLRLWIEDAEKLATVLPELLAEHAAVTGAGRASTPVRGAP